MNMTQLLKRKGALKKTLRVTLVVAVATVLFMPVNLQTALADPTSAEVQAEVDSVVALLAAKEAEMESLHVDYVAAVEAHDKALAAMQEAQDRIDEAEKRIKKTQEQLGNRADQMYRQGSLSYLDVLLGASSFEEFATSWELVNIINHENAKLIQTNKEARAEAEAAHEEYAAQERAAAEHLAQTEAVKAEAEALVAEQQGILAGLESEVAALVEQEQVARLEAAAEANRQNPTNQTTPNSPTTPATPSTPDTPQTPTTPETPSAPESPAPPPAGGYSDVVAAAASRIGCPYIWGATGPNDFDCSGLTSWCYLQAGRGWIGRVDYQQRANALASWSYSEGGAAPGDVLWWPGHVAIYAGGGTYIHAANPDLGVLYSSWDINSALVLRF